MEFISLYYDKVTSLFLVNRGHCGDCVNDKLVLVK
jgi:hypothetical protein